MTKEQFNLGREKVNQLKEWLFNDDLDDYEKFVEFMSDFVNDSNAMTLFITMLLASVHEQDSFFDVMEETLDDQEVQDSLDKALKASEAFKEHSSEGTIKLLSDLTEIEE